MAGGKGLRMQAGLPKQFMDVEGKPLLFYAVRAFTEAIPEIQIRLVLPEAKLGFGEEIRGMLPTGASLKLIAGGETRFHSVRNGLDDIPSGPGFVFVHDGVRPLVTADLIRACLSAAEKAGNAVPVIEVTDSIRSWDGTAYAPLNRDLLRSVQTPQVFPVEVLKAAFSQPYQPGFTDEATVVERAGIRVNLIPGAAENIKVTYPPDLITARSLLSKRAGISE